MKRFLLILLLIAGMFGLRGQTTTYSLSATSTGCFNQTVTCSNGNTYFGEIIKLTDLQIDGSTFRGKVVKCDGSKFINSGWVNFREGVCENHSINYNTVEKYFSSGDYEIPFAFTINSSFTSGSIGFMCAMGIGTPELPLGFFYTDDITVTATTNSGCNVPTGVTALNITDNSVKIDWDYDSNADDYTVAYRLSGGSWQYSTATSSSENISDLTSCSTYEYKVRTNCSNGSNSSYSSVKTFSTTGCGGGTCDVPTGVTALNITDNSVKIDWDYDSNADDYTVAYRLSGGSWQYSTATSSSENISGLTSCSTYEYKVRTNCSNGSNSSYSSVKTFSTTGCGGGTCDVPTGVTALNITDNSVKIDWDYDSNADDYSVAYRLSGGSWQYSTATSSYENISGLTSCSTYEYKVRTNCSNGSNSSYSSIKTFSTTGCGGGTCDIPTGLYETNITQNSATLNFSETIGAIEYSVAWYDGTWHAETGLTNNSVTIIGLTACTEHTWKAKVKCANGVWSSFSSTKTFTTIGCGSAPVANFSASNTTPTEGDAVTFTNLTTGTTPMTYSWSFPGGTPNSSTSATPPAITYSSQGLYQVSLTATNSINSDTETKSGYINVQQGCEDIGNLRTCDYNYLFNQNNGTSILKFQNNFTINSGVINYSNNNVFLENIDGENIGLFSGSGNFNVVGTKLYPSASSIQDFDQIARLIFDMKFIDVRENDVIVNGKLWLPNIITKYSQAYGKMALSFNIDNILFSNYGKQLDFNFGFYNIDLLAYKLAELEGEFDQINDYYYGAVSMEFVENINIGGMFEIQNGELNAIGLSGGPIPIFGGLSKINSVAGEMHNLTSSAPLFLRIEFEVTPPSVLENIIQLNVNGSYRAGNLFEFGAEAKLFHEPLAGAYGYWRNGQGIGLYGYVTLDAYIASLKADVNLAFTKNYIQNRLTFLGGFGGNLRAFNVNILTGYNVVENLKLYGYTYILGWKKFYSFGYNSGLFFDHGNHLETVVTQKFNTITPFFPDNPTKKIRSAEFELIEIHEASKSMIIEGKYNSGEQPFSLIFTNGDVILSNEIINNQYFDFQSNQDSFKLAIRNVESGNYMVDVSNINDLSVKRENLQPYIEIENITNNEANKTLTIQWKATDPDSDAKISLSFDTDNQNLNGRLIIDSLDKNTTEYIFDYSQITTGEYYIFAMINDGKTSPFYSYSEESFWLQKNGAPLPPNNLTLSSNDTSIILNWDRTEPNEYRKYNVYYSNEENNVNIWSNTIGAADTTQIILSNLLPGKYYEFVVTAYDSLKVESQYSNKVSTIWHSNTLNNPPFIEPQVIPHNAKVSEAYNYHLEVSDKDNDALTFTFLKSPQGMTIDNTGDILWTPTEEQLAFNYIEILVDDNNGGQDSIRFEILVSNDETSIASIDFNNVTYLDYYENAIISIYDEDFMGNQNIRDNISANAYSNSDPAGITFSLKEIEKNRNEFVGMFQFSETQSAGNELLVNYGDTIWVEYTDQQIVKKYAYFTEFKANFIDGGVACAGDSIQFVNKSTGTGMSYSWNFGDGNISDKRNPVHIFNPEPGIGTATYSVTLNIIDDEGRSSYKTQQVSVYRKPLVDIGNNVEGCGSVTLDAQNEGSTYEWITGETEQTIKTLEDGNYSVIVTNEYGCSNFDDVNVIVYPIPTPEFSVQEHICEDATTIDLEGNYDNQGTFFGEGVNGYLYDPLLTNVGFHEIGYWYMDEHGCVDTTYRTIEVRPLPEPEFIEADYEICITEILNLGAVPAGGEFSGDGVNNGVFSGISAGVGNHLLSYTYTDSYGCTNTTEQSATVFQLPEVSITGLNETYCLNSESTELIGYPVGGEFSGIGIYDNFFTPSIAGEGVCQITYSYVDPITDCENSITLETTVNGLPEVELTSPAYELCNTSDVITLSGAPVNGEFNGTGIIDQINGKFDPSQAEIGLNEITYTVYNLDGCAETETIFIEVYETPTSIITGDNEICEGSTATLVGSGGEEFLWSTNSTDQTITVSPSENTTYLLTVTNGGICSSQSEFDVIVNPIPEQPNILQDGMILSSDIFSAFYQWYLNSDELNNATNQSLLATEFGQYQVEIWDENGCSNISDIFSLGLTNINEVPGVNSIDLFPNPTDEILNIRFDLLEQKNIDINIYDSNGKLVVKSNNNNLQNINVKKIDLSKNSAGIYYVSILIDEYIIIRKIVLK